jgi:hypothetical protein
MRDQEMRLRGAVTLAVSALLCAAGCATELDPDDRGQSVGYRSGTANDDFRSNGERGNVRMTEINWAGSVSDTGLYDPQDVYIELQNKHPRPVHLTDWQLIIDSATNHPRDAYHASTLRARRTYVLPERAGGQPIQPNEYVIVARKNDGAFPNVDYVIPDLEIPKDFFQITLRDIDDRLIEPGGEEHSEVFAGGYDLVTVRTMERVQLLFSNSGSSEPSWHSYSYNVFDEDHAVRQENIREGFKLFTYGSPGKANSPDYSGNTSSGSFE